VLKLKQDAKYLLAKELVPQTTKEVIFGERREQSLMSGRTNGIEKIIDL